MSTPADLSKNAFSDLNMLMNRLDTRDERALVLSIAAFSEETLVKLIAAFLRRNKSAEKLLDGFNAPLGTFSAKIAAAHALGLINDGQYSDFEHLRKIRNEFAHSWKDISLARTDIASHIAALSPAKHIERSSSPAQNLRNTFSETLVALNLHAHLIPRLGLNSAQLAPARQDGESGPALIP